MWKILCKSSIVMLATLSAHAAVITENMEMPDSGWIFNHGKEFPGAQGSLTFDRKVTFGGQPVLRLEADFSSGGAYVAVDRKFTEPMKIDELRLQLRTGAQKINLRFHDSSNRIYQKEYILSGNAEEVQELVIRQFGGAKGFASWGAGSAGDFVQPMKGYSLTVHRTDLQSQRKWSTEFGNIRLSGDIAIKVQAAGRPDHWLVKPGGEISIPVLGVPTEGQRKYQLFSFGSDQPVASGVARLIGGVLALPVPKEHGFYEIVFPELDWRGGLIVDVDFQGKADPYFGIDAAFSIFRVYQEPKTFQSSVRFLKRSGITTVRDRLTWRALEPQEKKFNWTLGFGNGEAIRKFCRDEGFFFLDVWHDAPAWTGAAAAHENDSIGSPYPTDFLKTVETWRTVAENWNDKLSMLEVWNEPEIGFGRHLPGDQVTALHRAIAWAFQEADVDTKLCGGVFTGFFRAPEIIEPYIDNGILDVSDAFSFHDYQTPLQFEKMVQDFRQLISGTDRAGIPFLISECGKPWPRGGDRAPQEADRLSGAWIAAKAIEGKACGISQFYTFIYYFYNENLNNFGTMDQNFTPMRSMAAYSNVVRQLSGFEYAGDLPVQGVDRSRAFIHGDRAVIALYSEASNATAMLPTGFRPEQVTGIDGRVLPLPVNGKLAVADRLVYLHVSRAALEPFLNRNTEAMQLCRIARSYQPRPRVAKPLVYQFLPDLQVQPYNVDGYWLDSTSVKLTFAVNNLGDQPVKAAPRFELPGGAKTVGAPAEVELAPRSRELFTVTVDFGHFPKVGEVIKLRLWDANGAGEAVVLPFRKWDVEFFTVPAWNDSAERIDLSAPTSEGWYELTEWQAWQSEQAVPDIQASMRMFRTDDGLEVQVMVRDDVFYQSQPAASAWRGDSVQLTMQALHNNRIPGPKFAEITAAMTAKGPVVYRNVAIKEGKDTLLKKSSLIFRAGPGYQIYRIQLNAAELELGSIQPGMRMGMALLVNSNNGEVRHGYLKWGNGIGDSKNPRKFNQLLVE